MAEGSASTCSDYERMARAIAYIAERVGEQPGLEEVAAHVHLSPFHFQRLFARWVGTTPKRFLQVLTLERAKRLLAEAQPLLAVSEEIGFSSSSRLYDHFVQLEAMTPGEYRSGGAGLTIGYGLHGTPFGTALLGLTPRGLCFLEFVDGEHDAAVAQLHGRWPRAAWVPDQAATAAVIGQIFGPAPAVKRPLPLHIAGTNFQINVWKALLRIPAGVVASYGQVAAAIGRPGAARAVGAAVGANPVAFLIPCHRVIRETGELGGYRWGIARKQVLHSWEAAHYS